MKLTSRWYLIHNREAEVEATAEAPEEVIAEAEAVMAANVTEEMFLTMKSTSQNFSSTHSKYLTQLTASAVTFAISPLVNWTENPVTKLSTTFSLTLTKPNPPPLNTKLLSNLDKSWEASKNAKLPMIAHLLVNNSINFLNKALIFSCIE